MSRSTHKWYPTSGTHEVSKCSRNGFYWQIQQVVPYWKIISNGIIHTSGITSTHDINHTRWWFPKWSSTLSDHQIKNDSLNYKSSSVSNGWPMLWHKGRCPTNWYQGQRSYKWRHSNNQVMSIKNARFKPQPSTPNAYLCINEKHTFYGNWWQRGRDCTKIWKLWDWDYTRGRDKI